MDEQFHPVQKLELIAELCRTHKLPSPNAIDQLNPTGGLLLRIYLTEIGDNSVDALCRWAAVLEELEKFVIEQCRPKLHRVVAAGRLPRGPKVLVLQHADLGLRLPMGEFHRVTLQELKVIEETRWAGGEGDGNVAG